jgi:hypothetical protein
MSDLTWRCDADLPPDGLTVGQIYSVACAGSAVNWQKTDLEVVMPQEAKYHFHLISFDEVSAEKIKFSAVGYKTGQFEIQNIVMTDGENKIHLMPWNVKINSVIDAQPGMQPKPYGPFGPFTLEWPLWMWIALGVFVLAVVVSLVAAILEKRRKRLWAAIVAEYTTALSPYHQFYKDYRRLSRVTSPTAEDLKKLDESFRLYFLRELHVPTLTESSQFVLKWMRKRNPVLVKEIKTDLQMIYRELSKAKKSNFSAKDFEQMSRKCQQLVDQVYEGLVEVNQ